MVINKNNPNYRRMIQLLKNAGVKIASENEFAGCFLVCYFDEDEANLYLGTNVGTLCRMTGNSVKALMDVFFNANVSEKVVELCEGLDFVDKGDCPECGGWLDEPDYDYESGDHRGEILAYATYVCPLCGHTVREYDKEASSAAAAWEATKTTL